MVVFCAELFFSARRARHIRRFKPHKNCNKIVAINCVLILINQSSNSAVRIPYVSGNNSCLIAKKIPLQTLYIIILLTG